MGHVLLSVLLALCVGGCTEASGGQRQSVATAHSREPGFDKVFWQLWGDGQAELSGYDLTIPRYGQLRNGVAVAVFVTETFSDALRVKADRGSPAGGDAFPVMKLNLINDFQTGVYDYNTMTSTFVALTSHGRQQKGQPTKISYSSQEWCGHMYHQLLFDDRKVRQSLHSYFDGEADRHETLPTPHETFSGDVLPLWARGLAWPRLQKGESIEVSFLPSLQQARFTHSELKFSKATLHRGAHTETVSVIAGTFEVEVYTATIDDGTIHTLYTEVAPPHRIVKWLNSNGENAILRASKRFAYWKKNGNIDENALEFLGLQRRPPHTP